MKRAHRVKTINELRSEAKKRGIVLRRTMKKDEILKALSKGRSDASGRKTAAHKKTAAATANKSSLQKRPVRRVKTQNAENDLPQEYGENDLLLIVVDPETVFATWEIRKEDLPREKPLWMRFSALTTGPEEKPEKFRDVEISGRVGSGFFTIAMSGRKVVGEIGHLRRGEFRTILRSNSVSFPVASQKEGKGKETTEDNPVGY